MSGAALSVCVVAFPNFNAVLWTTRKDKTLTLSQSQPYRHGCDFSEFELECGSVGNLSSQLHSDAKIHWQTVNMCQMLVETHATDANGEISYRRG